MEELCSIHPRVLAFLALGFLFTLCGWVATVHMIIQQRKPEPNTPLFMELKGIAFLFYMGSFYCLITAFTEIP